MINNYYPIEIVLVLLMHTNLLKALFSILFKQNSYSTELVTKSFTFFMGHILKTKYLQDI